MPLIPIRIVNEPGRPAIMTRVEHAETGELLGHVQAFDVHLDMRGPEPAVRGTISIINPGLRIHADVEKIETFQIGSIEELEAEIRRLIGIGFEIMGETQQSNVAGYIRNQEEFLAEPLTNSILRAVLMRMPISVPGQDDALVALVDDLDGKVRREEPRFLSEHELSERQREQLDNG